MSSRYKKGIFQINKRCSGVWIEQEIPFAKKKKIFNRYILKNIKCLQLLISIVVYTTGPAQSRSTTDLDRDARDLLCLISFKEVLFDLHPRNYSSIVAPCCSSFLFLLLSSQVLSSRFEGLIAKIMSRRPVSLSRRLADGGGIPFVGSIQSKSHSSPLLSIGLVVVGAILIIGYVYSNSGGASVDVRGVSKLGGGASCTLEVLQALPVLKKAYGDSSRKVLHVGPDTCSVVSGLLKEEETEAWGIEPYELDDVSANCKTLVREGIVRAADIKFPLPYRAKSFSLVIVSDALDYLSPKYLNKTLPELARVAADGIVIFSGFPGQQRAKDGEVAKFGRPAKLRSSSWWIRFFVQSSLEENEAAGKKFEQAAAKRSYKPSCQVFHLKAYP